MRNIIPMQSLITDDLTVIIPHYKKSEKIERAVRSVLNQKIVPSSIIVIDDVPEEVSPQRIKKMQPEHSLIKLIEQKNGDVSSARNRGVIESETEYIAFLGADDKWLPEHTSNLLEVISKSRDADFYSIPYIIDTPKGEINPHIELLKGFNGIIPNFVKVYTNGYGLIHLSSVCFRRSFFFETGGFPEGIKSGGDTYLWLKAGLMGACASINKRSVVVNKKEINSLQPRKRDVPYQVSYFVEHLQEYNADDKMEIMGFLKKNVFLLWAEAKIEKNFRQREELRSYMLKINKQQWFLLLFSELIPSSLFKFVRDRHIGKRVNK